MTGRTRTRTRAADATTTGARRAVARSAPTRAPMPPHIARTANLLDAATVGRWTAERLAAALYATVWPALAPRTRQHRDTVLAATAWRRALTSTLALPWTNYRADLAALPAPPAHCPRCDRGCADGRDQPCDPCLALLRAGWDLRDAYAAAIADEVPARAALTVTGRTR